jgi:parvulin-like peptidyl-prolyl isomerase
MNLFCRVILLYWYFGIKKVTLMKSHCRIITISILVVCCLTSVAAQEERELPNDAVAKIGLESITSRDLIERVELMPFPDTVRKSKLDSVKVHALYAMLAERLLANQAHQMGMMEDSTTQRMRQGLENMLVCNELYEREVKRKVTLTEKEITTGMNRSTKKLRVLSFLVSNEAGGKALVQHLRSIRPDSIPGGIPRTLFAQCDTITIAFPSPDLTYEDAVYSIDKSRISQPFFSNTFGWAVLYLLEKQTDREITALSLSDRRHRVERILKERHEATLAEKFYSETLKTKRATADSLMFDLVADSIVGLWKQDTGRFHLHGGYVLTSDMVDVIIDRLRLGLERTFVTTEDGNLTVGEVLELFRYENFISRSLDGPPFRSDLNAAVKRLVARALLAREGRKQHLENSEGVVHTFRMWTDYWVAWALLNKLRDTITVSDEDVAQHLIRYKDIFGRRYEVNVREILCGSLEDISTAMQKVYQGELFSDIARRFSLRAEWAGNGGESGFFTVDRHPEIGFRALEADTGKLVGPLNLNEGYSIFMVLGKRRAKNAAVNFNTLAASVRTRLLKEKQQHTTDRFIAELARKQKVTVNYTALKNVKISPIPMFTRRYLGFGGVMTAIPLLMQQWNWIKEFQQSGKFLP